MPTLNTKLNEELIEKLEQIQWELMGFTNEDYYGGITELASSMESYQSSLATLTKFAIM